MNRFAFALFLLPLLLAASPAETPPPAPPARDAASARELALVVVTSVTQSGRPSLGADTDFDRLDLAFQDVAQRRHWPVKIVAERFAANTPAHELELRVYLQPVRQDLPGQFTFRGWMTLTERGTKHDFGIIAYRQQQRAGEPMDDLLEKIFHGGASVAARKIEPILFPQLAESKP